jgi:hypothetical protein
VFVIVGVSLVIVLAAVFGSTSGNSGNDTTTKPEKHTSQPHNPAPEKKTPDVSVSQQQALEAAQSYVDTMEFSKAGLLDQLTSSAGENFSQADAEYAVNHVDADWNSEAVEAAQGYMDIGGFSRASLIDQLTSPAGDQFTKAQAEYAADQVGL